MLEGLSESPPGSRNAFSTLRDVWFDFVTRFEPDEGLIARARQLCYARLLFPPHPFHFHIEAEVSRKHRDKFNSCSTALRIRARCRRAKHYTLYTAHCARGWAIQRRNGSREHSLRHCSAPSSRREEFHLQLEADSRRWCLTTVRPIDPFENTFRS